MGYINKNYDGVIIKLPFFFYKEQIIWNLF